MKKMLLILFISFQSFSAIGMLKIVPKNTTRYFLNKALPTLEKLNTEQIQIVRETYSNRRKLGEIKETLFKPDITFPSLKLQGNLAKFIIVDLQTHMKSREKILGKIELIKNNIDYAMLYPTQKKIARALINEVDNIHHLAELIGAEYLLQTGPLADHYFSVRNFKINIEHLINTAKPHTVDGTQLHNLKKASANIYERLQCNIYKDL